MGHNEAAKHELAKIEAYFEEGRKLWQRNPEMVLSRQFFELWEESQHPQPFPLDPPALEFLGQQFPVDRQPTVACFTWDYAEECASLVLESTADVRRIAVVFEDGEPVVADSSAEVFDDDAISAGERLEFVMDVIAQIRSDHPSRNVLNMRKSEYTAALRQISGWYDQRTVKMMSTLKIAAIHKLVKRAVQDMALDELSDQLTLPLNGSYAVAGNTNTMVVGGDTPFAVHPSPPRTRWTVAGDLTFLSRAGHVLADLETEFVLRFENCEVLMGENPVYLRVPLTQEVPIRSNERLQVYRRGENVPVAAFTIEINDRTSLIGRLQWPDEPEEITCDYYARPKRSPARTLAQLMEAFANEFLREGRFESAALNAALGVEDFSFEDAAVPRRNELGFDRSQCRAWANAVNPQNALTLIQGPPGTGKTHVLVQILRDFVKRGLRVLVAAPSNTAVDNVCRRALDLPLLRVGHDRDRIAPNVADACWIGDLQNVQRFQNQRDGDTAIYAGTHVGLLHDDIIQTELEHNGLFDAIVFDEAGMARMDEFLICTKMARRAVLIGDHRQLPPFPLPEPVLRVLREEGEATLTQRATLTQSALEWLVTQRKVPVFVLQSSYRCQNPRLMRFSSTVFYNAQVKASVWADYYRLPYDERQQKYPPSTLRLYSTSSLPLAQRREQLNFEGGRPGFENALEAELAVHLAVEAMADFPLQQVTIIAPYRRQVHLIRDRLDRETAQAAAGKEIPDEEWELFRKTRISTVDSFQGGESDIVLVCYVRSNEGTGVGFVDDPNRINVAHTRCRRKMIIIGDIDFLKRHARNRIFHRMERAIRRDGEIIPVDHELAARLLAARDSIS